MMPSASPSSQCGFGVEAQRLRLAGLTHDDVAALVRPVWRVVGRDVRDLEQHRRSSSSSVLELRLQRVELLAEERRARDQVGAPVFGVLRFFRVLLLHRRAPARRSPSRSRSSRRAALPPRQQRRAAPRPARSPRPAAPPCCAAASALRTTSGFSLRSCIESMALRVMGGAVRGQGVTDACASRSCSIATSARCPTSSGTAAETPHPATSSGAFSRSSPR